MQSDVILGVGDRLPGLKWVDHQGAPFSPIDDHRAGKVSVLFVCAAAEAPGVERLVARLGELHEAFDSLEVQAFVVTAGPAAENAALAGRLYLPFPVICDADFAMGRARRPARPLEAAPRVSAQSLLFVHLAAITSPEQSSAAGLPEPR